MSNLFLFSVDLEDVRSGVPDGFRYAERVPAMTEHYLQFLDRHKARCTFFVVGDVARRYPELISTIAAAGHEVACHTTHHVPLDKQSRESFKKDLSENVELINRAGASVCGFRAPVFSLTEKTSWAHEVLAEMGFLYSSSVLPAKNPLYGWPGFGTGFQKMTGDLWELPITLFPWKALPYPCAGGVYFRTLPQWLTRMAFQQHWKNQTPVLSYFHPYDIDTGQERFMHPGIQESRLYNALMYYNRSGLLDKVTKLLKDGATILPYKNYVKEYLVAGNGPKQVLKT